jgi:hypothetical protein
MPHPYLKHVKPEVVTCNHRWSIGKSSRRFVNGKEGIMGLVVGGNEWQNGADQTVRMAISLCASSCGVRREGERWRSQQLARAHPDTLLTVTA